MPRSCKTVWKGGGRFSGEQVLGETLLKVVGQRALGRTLLWQRASVLHRSSTIFIINVHYVGLKHSTHPRLPVLYLP